MDTDPYRQLHALLPLQTGIERRGDRRDDASPRMHAAQGIVFMRHRPAKIHQQPIAEILRDVARVLLNHCGGGRLIRPHDLAQVFGVELLREPGGVRQVAEHHGQLPAFGFRGRPPSCLCGVVLTICLPGCLRRFRNRRRHAITGC
jgi:hypothetical protein